MRRILLTSVLAFIICFSLAFGLAVLKAAASPAAAAERNLSLSCAFEEPSDGFIALRQAPSRSSAMITRMSPDGFFYIVMRNGKVVEKDGWLYIVYVAPDADDAEAIRRGPRGWMHKSLSAGCDA